MKVFIVGANGQIGRHLIDQLQADDGHAVRAMVRSEEQARAFEQDGIEARVADLEGNIEDIAKAAEGSDVVVFTAGSGGHTGADKTMLIDLDGAAKTIEAAKQAGIERFIMVSSIYANRREKWGKMSYYMAAKHHADNILRSSGLTYTIIRPGGLTNEPGTGKVTIEKSVEAAYVPREDVARTIVETLSRENTYNRSFDLISGDDLIVDALNIL